MTVNVRRSIISFQVKLVDTILDTSMIMLLIAGLEMQADAGWLYPAPMAATGVRIWIPLNRARS